jgi:predicted ester cyclase
MGPYKRSIGLAIAIIFVTGMWLLVLVPQATAELKGTMTIAQNLNPPEKGEPGGKALSEGTLEKNKDIARRFIQLWGKGDRLRLIDEFASPEITVYYPVFPHVIKGIEALKGYFTKRLPSMFGDTDVQVEEVIAEGDKVVVRYNWSATHQGEWPPGTPATGKRLKLTGIVIYRIVDGKVVDERGEEDYLAPFRELGILPKPRTQ